MPPATLAVASGPPRPVSVTRTRTAVTTAEHATLPVHAALRGLVRSITGYDQHVTAGTIHLGVPSTGLMLVVSFDLPQRIGPADRRRPAVDVRSFVAGIHDELVAIEASRFHGVQVELTPLGALRLFGPVGELARRIVPLADVLGRLGDRLDDRLAHTATWAARLTVVERLLLERLSVGPPVRPELPVALDRLAASGGRVPVQQLADELAWSRRHLSGTFSRAFGLPPKRLAQLTRLERVTADLDRGCDLATVAAAAGFADQAHLSNEVRTFTGLTPSQLRARHLPEGWFEVAPAASGGVGRARGSHPSKTASPPRP